MDQPKIPTLKDSQKPQVKVRGLEAGATLFDRLKQFKKKDLAFILAGLGTLFMAPLAEHFMMSPEGGDSTLGAGFSGKGAKGIFNGDGSVSPYETGVNGQAPGSAVGGGSDVITPLNVRDPSALVMGPGATQQPPTNSVAPSVTPPTAPVTHSDSDLKDALAASARGVGAAAKAAKAVLPVPKVALGGSGLRGLGVSSGGSSATAGPISSAGLATGKANAGGGGLNQVRALPGYKGVGTRGQSAGSNSIDALKAAGEKAGDMMNRGSALNALDQTAAQQIPNGGSAGGGAGEGGMGGGDKAGGGNGGKDSKSTGESLEFLKQKAMQEAQIALWAKEQEAGDSRLELLKIRNSMAEAIAGKLGGAIGDAVSCPITPGKNFKKCYGQQKDPGQYVCTDTPVKGASSQPVPISGGDVGDCSDGAAYWISSGENIIYQCGSSGSGDKAKGINDRSKPMGYNCVNFGADSASGSSKATKDGPGGVGNAGNGSMATRVAMNKMGATCNDIDTLITDPGIKDQKDAVDYLKSYRAQTANAVQVRDGLTGSGSSGDCTGGSPVKGLSVTDHLKNSLAALTPGAMIDGSLIPAVPLTKSDGAADKWAKQYQTAVDEYNAAKSQMAQLNQPYGDLKKYLDSGADNSVPSALAGRGRKDFVGLRQSSTMGSNSLQATKQRLDNAIAHLGTLLTGEGAAAANSADAAKTPSHGPLSKVQDPKQGSLIGVIQVNETFATKIDAYNKAVDAFNKSDPPPAKPVQALKADLTDGTDKSQQGGTTQDQSKDKPDVALQAVTDATKAAKDKLDPVAKQLDAFVKTPSADKAVTQDAVDPVKKPILDMQKAQTDNLKSLSADFQGVAAEAGSSNSWAGTGTPTASGLPLKTSADNFFVPPNP